jgi:hypothetical protein
MARGHSADEARHSQPRLADAFLLVLGVVLLDLVCRRRRVRARKRPDAVLAGMVGDEERDLTHVVRVVRLEQLMTETGSVLVRAGLAGLRDERREMGAAIR